MSWRDRARPIIAKVLADTKGQDEKAIKVALFNAYPFGPREYHPYKVWLDEIRRQRKLRRTKPLSKADRERIAAYEAATGKKWPTSGDLFGEKLSSEQGSGLSSHTEAR
jgi:hypothetical protein